MRTNVRIASTPVTAAAKPPTHRESVPCTALAPMSGIWRTAAPAMAGTAMRKENAAASGALTTGVSIGYGWINYLRECKINFNQGIGLHVYNSANNIDVTSCQFEGNGGPAIYVSGGNQISIHGNVIEGNNGPGIVAMGARGLTIDSTYFEVCTRRLLVHTY